MGDSRRYQPAGFSFLVAAAIVIVLAALKVASAIVVPFMLSVFVAIICNPLVERLCRFHIPRGLSIVLVIMMILLLGFLLAGLVGQSLNDFSQSLPIYQQQLQAKALSLVTTFDSWGIQLNESLLTEHFDPGAAMSLVATTLSGIGNVMANGFLILLTVVFMLLEAPYISRKVHLALSDPEEKMQAIDQFLKAVNSYLSIKTVVSLATGFVIGLSLWFLGVQYFVLWGVLAFLLNYIPNIGSIIAAVPAVLLALVTQGLLIAGLTGLVYVVVNVVMGNVIEPRFMGKGLGLSTLVVFLSLILWGWLLGTAGMLLSIPLTMIVKIALSQQSSTSRLSYLLADTSEDSSKQE